MDWIRKNRFLAGFLGLVVAAAGALGYLVFAQMGTYDQTSQDYDAAVRELDRLQTATVPFPYQKSKAALIQISKDTAVRVTELQKRLADYEPPAERADFKPVEFQDKLRRVVEETVGAARAANVELPADFYMGFEQYRGAPPTPEAAPALSRELDAVQDLMKILIARHIEKLNSLRRAPLPQEPGGAGASATTSLADSVARFPLDVAFSGQPSAFRESLDDVVNSKRLFLVRALQVKNQVQKGPSRESPTGSQSLPAAAANPDTPGLAPAPEKPSMTYIVGQEKLDVDMRVEIIKVTPPATVAAR